MNFEAVFARIESKLGPPSASISMIAYGLARWEREGMALQLTQIPELALLSFGEMVQTSKKAVFCVHESVSLRGDVDRLISKLTRHADDQTRLAAWIIGEEDDFA